MLTSRLFFLLRDNKTVTYYISPLTHVTAVISIPNIPGSKFVNWVYRDLGISLFSLILHSMK